MKRIWKPLAFVLLNVLFLCVLLWSLVIYTSTFEASPWYESCGMQFMAIFIISDPSFLILGITLLALSKFFPISKINKWLPFIAIAGLSLPLFGPLNRGILIGLPINITLCLFVVVTTITTLVSNRRVTKK